MQDDDLIEALAEADLSEYQARAYVSLLELGTATAGELAAASDVPRPRVYDVLRTLEERGYVETYEQDTLRARIPDPHSVTEDLEARMSELETATGEIERRWTNPAPDAHEVSVVSRFETVLKRTASFIDEANYHVQLSVTPSQFERFRPHLEDAYARGVYVQVSLHSTPSDALDPGTFEGVCTEVRSRSRPASYLALVDQTRVCYAAHIDALNEYGVIVDDRTHAYVFLWFYLTTLWELWDPVYDARDDDLPREYLEIRRFVRDVVPLLRDGATVTVRVVGRDTETVSTAELRGTVADVSWEGREGADITDVSLMELAGQVGFELDCEDGTTRSIGGFGAMVEEIEANRIVVEAIH